VSRPHILLVICAAYRSAIATRNAWRRLLSRLGYSVEEIDEAIEKYMVLVNDEPEEYMVKPGICEEVTVKAAEVIAR